MCYFIFFKKILDDTYIFNLKMNWKIMTLKNKDECLQSDENRALYQNFLY